MLYDTHNDTMVVLERPCRRDVCKDRQMHLFFEFFCTLRIADLKKKLRMLAWKFGGVGGVSFCVLS